MSDKSAGSCRKKAKHYFSKYMTTKRTQTLERRKGLLAVHYMYVDVLTTPARADSAPYCLKHPMSSSASNANKKKQKSKQKRVRERERKSNNEQKIYILYMAYSHSAILLSILPAPAPPIPSL